MENQDLSRKEIELHENLRKGLAAFNQGDYFEAHEIWEDMWRVISGQEKEAYQALIQTAVGLVHHQRNKPAAGRRLAGRALKRLEPLSDQLLGMDLAALAKLLATWTEGGKVPLNLNLELKN